MELLLIEEHIIGIYTNSCFRHILKEDIIFILFLHLPLLIFQLSGLNQWKQFGVVNYASFFKTNDIYLFMYDIQRLEGWFCEFSLVNTILSPWKPLIPVK